MHGLQNQQVELEIESTSKHFKDSEKCCDFAYQIKGINNQKEDGFNVTIRAATAQEKKHISELIESAAENAYNIIIGSEVNEDEKS